MKKMSTEDRIRACAVRNPDWSDGRIANSVGVKVAHVALVRAGAAAPTAAPGGEPDSGFVSLDRVRARYDIKAAIYRELAAVPRGKVLSEAELCTRAAGSDKSRFRRTVENNESEFKPLRLKLKLTAGDSEGKFFWGHAEDIAEALRIRDL